jgi:hypothetical protein
MSLKSIYSSMSACLLALGVVLFLRAEIAYTESLRNSESNLALVSPLLFSLFGSTGASGFSPASSFAVTERSLFLLALVASAVCCAAALILAYVAKRRAEPSHLWAGPAVLSLALAVLVGRLVVWSIAAV